MVKSLRHSEISKTFENVCQVSVYDLIFMIQAIGGIVAVFYLTYGSHLLDKLGDEQLNEKINFQWKLERYHAQSGWR